MAASDSIVNFGQYPQLLAAYQGSIGSFKSIDIWWRGLTLVQRRQEYYRERLVERTEEALQQEILSLDRALLHILEELKNKKKKRTQSRSDSDVSP